MKIIERIPEYSLEVRFYDNLIECYDLISNEIVASKTFIKRIVDIHKSKENSFLLLNEKRKAIGLIAIEIDLMKEISRLATEAGYILEICMDTPTHGYYFGYYEIGEFSLSDNKLLIKRSFPLKYCTKGSVTHSRQVFLGFREDDTIKSLSYYYLMKLDWKERREPRIVWKKPIPSAIMAIYLIDNKLILGLKNGIFQIWDVEKDELIKSFNLFESTISVIEMEYDKIIAASWTGETAMMSKNGTVYWKTKLSEDKIIGIYEHNNNIMFIDTKGNLFQIDLTSGILLKKDKWNVISVKDPALASNIIDFRDWFIVSGYGGMWAFWSKDYNKIYHLYMEGPLIRILHQHPIGFFSGDDQGYIRFWKLGKVKIRSLAFIGREY